MEKTNYSKWMKIFAVFLTLIIFIEATPQALISKAVDLLSEEQVNLEIADDSEISETLNDNENDKNSAEAFVVGEIEEKRESNVKHFKMSDGTITAAVYPYAVHYMNEDGRLVDIDNSFTDGRDENDDVYENRKNGYYNIKFMKKSNKNKLYVLDLSGHKIRVSIDGAQKSSAEREAFDYDSSDKFALYNLSESVTYRDILDKIDIEYIAVSDRVKENIIIKERVPIDEITYNINLDSDLEIIQKDEKTLFIREKTNNTIITSLSAPSMFDSRGRVSDNITLNNETDKT